jgi:hypothetical protein
MFSTLWRRGVRPLPGCALRCSRRRVKHPLASLPCLDWPGKLLTEPERQEDARAWFYENMRGLRRGLEAVLPHLSSSYHSDAAGAADLQQPTQGTSGTDPRV